MSDALSTIGSAAVTTIGTVAVAKVASDAVTKTLSGRSKRSGKSNYNVWSQKGGKRKSSKSMMGW